MSKYFFRETICFFFNKSTTYNLQFSGREENANEDFHITGHVLQTQIAGMKFLFLTVINCNQST